MDPPLCEPTTKHFNRIVVCDDCYMIGNVYADIYTRAMDLMNCCVVCRRNVHDAIIETRQRIYTVPVVPVEQRDERYYNDILYEKRRHNMLVAAYNNHYSRFIVKEY